MSRRATTIHRKPPSLTVFNHDKTTMTTIIINHNGTIVMTKAWNTVEFPFVFHGRWKISNSHNGIVPEKKSFHVLNSNP